MLLLKLGRTVGVGGLYCFVLFFFLASVALPKVLNLCGMVNIAEVFFSSNVN